jgi:hypothetical protein
MDLETAKLKAAQLAARISGECSGALEAASNADGRRDFLKQVSACEQSLAEILSKVTNLRRAAQIESATETNGR